MLGVWQLEIMISYICRLQNLDKAEATPPFIQASCELLVQFIV